MARGLGMPSRVLFAYGSTLYSKENHPLPSQATCAHAPLTFAHSLRAYVAATIPHTCTLSACP